MFKKNKYEYYGIIPEVFNNKNTEILDDSPYKGDLFKKTSELNDFFIKFVSSLQVEEKSLYKYFKTQRFSLNQEKVFEIEKKLDELDENYASFQEFWDKVREDFYNHLKNKYS